jgi:phenylalanine-4-hydroxylase
MQVTPDKVKHGLAGGAAPQRADWTIDQGWSQYTADEHAVWKTLFNRQTQLLPGLACDAFVQGMQNLPLSADRIPGNFIRKPHELDYLEEPDVFHDVFGHVPMLMNPVMADFIQAYGHAGLAAKQIGKLTELARVYWYTVEFGLVRQAEGLRIYGAGIASSFSESSFAVQSDSPNRIGFELERVMRTHYRIDDFQESYFVLNELQDLLELANIEFAPYYARLDRGPSYQPGDVLVADTVLHRGTGSYHCAKPQK